MDSGIATHPVQQLQMDTGIRLHPVSPGFSVHAAARHPADRRLADLRRLARTRPSRPGARWLFHQVSPGSR